MLWITGNYIRPSCLLKTWFPINHPNQAQAITHKILLEILMGRKEMTVQLILLNEPEYYLQKQKPIRYSAVSEYRGMFQTFWKYSLAHSKLLCKIILFAKILAGNDEDSNRMYINFKHCNKDLIVCLRSINNTILNVFNNTWEHIFLPSNVLNHQYFTIKYMLK